WWRILDPVRQAERFDPGGDYVRRWLPELADVPDAWLARPWTMPLDVGTRVGCRIGADYPPPIVDHGAARERALAAWRTRRDAQRAEGSTDDGSTDDGDGADHSAGARRARAAHSASTASVAGIL
ncbi:MAG TPA: FAD-binding domain-containing protein, partial [Candidatus Limnocylindrales bacterium]